MILIILCTKTIPPLKAFLKDIPLSKPLLEIPITLKEKPIAKPRPKIILTRGIDYCLKK